MPLPTDALSRPQRLAIAAATVFTVAAGVTAAAGAPYVARFAIAALALAALAVLVGESIEQIGEHLGPGPTGLLQSSLGNLPELFVAIFALRKGLTSVVQAALVGSVLGNVLLVLGAAFLSGGARHGAQKFRPEAPRMLVTLLALAVGATLVPTLAVRLETPAGHHAAALSDVAAIVLLAVYVASIPFWLSGGPQIGQVPHTKRRAVAGHDHGFGRRHCPTGPLAMATRAGRRPSRHSRPGVGCGLGLVRFRPHAGHQAPASPPCSPAW